jgi:hypothetical protein
MVSEREGRGTKEGERGRDRERGEIAGATSSYWLEKQSNIN